MNLSGKNFEAMAVEQARRSRQEPNRVPLFVGAIATQEGRVLGVAHRGEIEYGEHAEFTLLERKLKDVQLAGASIFTTLEPCTRRGPGKVPCVERLIERRVSHVVIGTLDPNPNIRGLGMIALRNAGISVALFGTGVAEIEELNRDFFRSHQKAIAPDKLTPGLLTALAKRSLDQWYIALNATYFHRNFDRRPSEICLHLIEVIGGMSLLASNKVKPNVDKNAQVQKALAWWMALCGKVGVRSVEAMVWDKFPRLCPYCQRSPHNQEECGEKKRAKPGPPWDVLATLGEKASRPTTLGEWQRMFNDVYPANQGDEYGPAFARLYEELAELAEAVRVFPSVPGYFLSEAADVFAWLMRVQNIIDEREERRGANRGRALEESFARVYYACGDCGQLLCACPPILATTIGRIAHEVPTGRGSYEPTGRFMTPDKAAEQFGPMRNSEDSDQFQSVA